MRGGRREEREENETLERGTGHDRDLEREAGSKRDGLALHFVPVCLDVLCLLGCRSSPCMVLLAAFLMPRRERMECLNQAERQKKKLKKLEKMGSNACETKNFKEALELYGTAIEMAGDRAPATYFSNRAVAWAALGEWQHARNDAEKAMQCPNGITIKMLRQKVQAELMLEEIDAAEQTIALAYRCGLREEVDELLKARDLSQPDTLKSTTNIEAKQLEQVQHERSQSVVLGTRKNLWVPIV